MNIINLSDLRTDWFWLKDEFKRKHEGLGQSWFHYSSANSSLAPWLPKRDSAARAAAAFQAIKHARMSPAVLISHGPRPAMYGGMAAGICGRRIPHLVFSFNFTDLPIGAQRRLMMTAFKQPIKFVCYSKMERYLYADYFNIPLESIDMIHWSVHAPRTQSIGPPIVAGDYICAIGSQARDYATIFSVIRRLKHIKLVLVTTENAIQGLSVPENVVVYSGIPIEIAQNILAHSRFMVLPLLNGGVPCGHVTLVSGMFLGKGIICTNSKGILDYIQDEQTGILVEPKNVDAWIDRISMLWADETRADMLGQQALSFAQKYCTEKVATDYFSKFLNDYC